jgi:transposase
MEVKFNDVFKRSLTREELVQLNKSDLVELVSVYQARENILLQGLQGALALAEQLAEATVAMSKRLFKTLDVFFNQSFRSRPKARPRSKKPKKMPDRGKMLPSERYPGIPIFQHEVVSFTPMKCECGHEMTDSGMRESSERLEVHPRLYQIIRFDRVKYTCKKCHVGIATAPPFPQIIPGSCYGDSIVKDVVLSKLCDLIPITRYVAMAARQGIEDIPANSLYEFSRHLAIFCGPSYARLMQEIKAGWLLQADETRHRMLEGSIKKIWYLWSFNSSKGVVFFVEDTRAGEIAEKFLKNCECRVLVSDAYRGYSKAVNILNEIRPFKVQTAYCNAHARNNFRAKSIRNTRQSKYVTWIYKVIFACYKDFQSLDGEGFDKAKAKMERAFKMLKTLAEKEMPGLSSKSLLYDAFDYIIKYYEGLTLFLTDRAIPMHNNQSERTLRNPVVGRKIWYGTHSPDTARDLMKIMSLVESCKMLKVNPRAYFDDLVNRVHEKQPAVSPFEYKHLQSVNSS